MNDRPAKGLGKGLSALLGDAKVANESGGEPEAGGVREIELVRIRRNESQPRTQFDEGSLEELSRSIAERGVLQPILVRKTEDGGFEIIAGERRWRAAQRARLHKIPAIVREFDDEQTAEVALIENVQREDLNAIEEARGYRQLIDRFGHKQEDLARLVHKSRSHVANLLRLLALPETVQQSLLRGDISMGHARAVATANDPEALVKDIIARGLSVRQAESHAKKEKRGPGEIVPLERAVDADLAALERQLSDLLGIKVQVGHKDPSGTVVLHYSSLDQLDMICQRLSGETI